jgi:hypothetical protein
MKNVFSVEWRQLYCHLSGKLTSNKYKKDTKNRDQTMKVENESSLFRGKTNLKINIVSFLVYIKLFNLFDLKVEIQTFWSQSINTTYKLVVGRRRRSEFSSPFVHPLDGLRHVGRGQANVLKSRTSVAVEKVLHVRVGILLQRLGQHQLKVQTEKLKIFFYFDEYRLYSSRYNRKQNMIIA